MSKDPVMVDLDRYLDSIDPDYKDTEELRIARAEYEADQCDPWEDE